METLWNKIRYKPRNSKEADEENINKDGMLDSIAVKDNAGFFPEYKKTTSPSGPGQTTQ